MMKRFFLLVIFSMLAVSQFVFLAHADSTDPFDLNIPEDATLQFQSLTPSALVRFTVQSGDLNGTAMYGVTSTGGWITITTETSGLLFVTSNYTQTWITVNGLTHTAPYNFLVGGSFTFTWTWTAAPLLPVPVADWLLGGDVSLLLTYLQSGDYLGFIMACYTTRIGQLAYVLIILMFTIPLALRTQSITYVAIVWIILGGLFQAAVPLVAPAMVIFEILGIGTLIFRLFVRE